MQLNSLARFKFQFRDLSHHVTLVDGSDRCCALVRGFSRYNCLVDIARLGLEIVFEYGCRTLLKYGLCRTRYVNHNFRLYPSLIV